MHNISDFMAGDHRHCDEFFAAAEQAVEAGQWDNASERFAAFSEALLRHFQAEESLLFPAFEARTGMTMGPTQVMRGEHEQMRELVGAVASALAAHDADAYAGETETLLIMMQQHNMKEENILYPMCDQHLGGELDTLVPRLRQEIGAALDA